MSEWLWVMAVGAAFGAGWWIGWCAHRRMVVRTLRSHPRAWLEMVAKAGGWGLVDDTEGEE